MAGASSTPGGPYTGLFALALALVVSTANAQESPIIPSDSVRADTTTVSDTAIVLFPSDSLQLSRFIPPERWRGAQHRELALSLAGPSWPMLPRREMPGGDLADWLTYHPAYDVDDGPGIGQTRFFTHRGLASRTGEWMVDGRSIEWQRLTFPLTAQFDAGILPSFRFQQYHFGNQAILESDTSWGERPQFDYVFRQGDFSDTYSEGGFRAHTAGGFGLDGDFLFSSSDGRFASDERSRRYLSLALNGPVSSDRLWHAAFTQFRDKSRVLTPEPFDLIHPQRNDLLWKAELAMAAVADSEVAWSAGASIQSGRQRLTDPAYRLRQHDQRWELFGGTSFQGWNIDARAGIEDLEIDSMDVDRWFARAAASRFWRLYDAWNTAVSFVVSDYDTDPPELEAILVLAPTAQSSLIPHLRAERKRTVPTLFDRERPALEIALIDASQAGFLYSESGDPALADQWENALTISWGADTPADSGHWHWNLAGHASYVENYTVWEGHAESDTLLGNPVIHWRYSPISRDARVFGAAIGVHGHLFWKLNYLANYAAKYATDLDDARLSGYHPHKASAILSLDAPDWKYGVDVNIHAAGLWWYGDRRIDPTGYDSPHVYRLDLGGSARIADLTIQAIIQNVANFPYRTRAGYPFTGRTVRFGFQVILFD